MIRVAKYIQAMVQSANTGEGGSLNRRETTLLTASIGRRALARMHGGRGRTETDE